MKTATNTKSLMNMNSNTLSAQTACRWMFRSAADQMGKELKKQIGDHEERLHFTDQMIVEGKRTRTTHKKESFTQASIESYL